MHHIGKHIRSQGVLHEGEMKYKRALKNIKEFLNYLESKGIITKKTLADRKSLKVLIKDLVQLDLSKFCAHGYGSKLRAKYSGSATPQPNSSKAHSRKSSTKHRRTGSATEFDSDNS